MLKIGEQTYIRTWNGAGKQSFMPLRWVLDGWAGVDRSNRAGEQVVVTPLGPGNAVSIYSRGYYQKSEVTVVAADTVLTLWGGDPVQASLLRPGMQLQGMFGMFVVERAVKGKLPLWSVNAEIALYIHGG